MQIMLNLLHEKTSKHNIVVIILVPNLADL